MSAEFTCPPEHKHAVAGTCYVMHKCRCQPCRAARATRERTRKRLKAYGRYDTGLVDAAPVREHIEYLQAFGYGWKRVGELSGVRSTAVSQLIYGRKGGNTDPRKGEVLKRVSRDKAEKILALKPDVSLLAGGAFIPSRSTHRRVQALVTIGWSQSKLAARLGMHAGNFSSMLRREHVTVATHRQVAAMYEELWATLPEREAPHDRAAFNRAKSYAAARRWVPPMGWDDIDTDPEPPVPDEDGGIDEMAVALAVQGERVRLTREERRAAVVELHAARLSDGAIAERMHVSDRTVLRIRQELGLPAAGGADGEAVA